MELYTHVRSEETGKVDFVFELYKNIDRQLAHIALHNKLVWLATFRFFILLFICKVFGLY